jgi:obg-like ATPase 1
MRINRKYARDAKDKMFILDKVTEIFNNNKQIRYGEWAPNTKEIDFLYEQLFMTSKAVVNLDKICYEEYKKKNIKYLLRITKWIWANGGGPIISFSAKFEKEVMSIAQSLDMTIRDKAAEELGAPSIIAKIVASGYNHLHLARYFTAGEDEVKCWTMRDGTNVPRADGVIHADFERGLIWAEVMAYYDIVREGSESNVRAEVLYHRNEERTMEWKTAISSSSNCFVY